MVKLSLRTCLCEDFSDEFYKKYHDSIDIPSGLEIDVKSSTVYLQPGGQLMGSNESGKNVSLGSAKGWRAQEWQKFFADHGVSQIVNNISSKRIRPGTYSPEKFLAMISGQ